MPGLRHAGAWLACLALVFLALACSTDDGIVGEAAKPTVAPPMQPSQLDAGATTGGSSGCPESCNDEERCHPQLRTCVECVTDADCMENKSPWCDLEDFECIGCRTSADCTLDEPLCSDDKCVECLTTADCDAPEQCDEGQCSDEIEEDSSP